MVTSSVISKLKQIKDLPVLPAIMNEINKVLADPRSNATTLANVIMQDQSLVTKILKLVNSAYYGFPRRITSLNSAVVILGLNTIKNIVLSVSFIQIFSKVKNTKIFDLKDFWKHSLAVGITSKIIGKKIGYLKQEELFLIGLVHDIGKIITNIYVPELFIKCFAVSQRQEVPYYIAEKELTKDTHDAIAQYLLDMWKLPQLYLEGVGFHHMPLSAPNHKIECSILHIADTIVKGLGIGKSIDSRIPPIEEDAWRLINLQPKHLRSIFDEVEKEYHNGLIFLEFIGDETE